MTNLRLHCREEAEGTEGTKGFGLQSFWRVLDIVEVVDALDFSAPLSPEGATAYR